MDIKEFEQQVCLEMEPDDVAFCYEYHITVDLHGKKESSGLMCTGFRGEQLFTLSEPTSFVYREITRDQYKTKVDRFRSRVPEVLGDTPFTSEQ